jgi:predicted CxxxxCH...CXXCH cytochrome family protein
VASAPPTNAYDPSSGLHAVSSILAHDDSFDTGYSCRSCHNYQPSDAHYDGTFNTPSNATYYFSATNVSSYVSTGCAANCHAPAGGDNGTWYRKWAGVTDAAWSYTNAQDNAVCDNCHGSFFHGWRWDEVALQDTDHTDPAASDGGDNMGVGSHSDCDTCHGWSRTGYDTGSFHVNGSITMNSDVGYDNTTGGCTGSCHSVSGLTMDTDSGWSNDSSAFGGVGCMDCHANGKPPASGAHQSHMANADTNYSECEVCHGPPANGDWDPLVSNHNNSSVAFTSTITYDDGGTPGTMGSADDDTCTTTICHSPTGNSASWGDTGYDWGGASSIGCGECHYYAASPTSSGNTNDANPLSATHTTHFGAGKVCTDCHSVTIPATDDSHITDTSGADSGAVLINMANASLDEATVTRTSMTYSYGGADGTGANNQCSGGIGLGCHATGTPDWDVEITNCTDCHTDHTAGLNPTSGLHDASGAAQGVTYHDENLSPAGCENCHVESLIADHQNGTLNTSNSGGALGIDNSWQAGDTVAYTDAGGTGATRGTCQSDCHSDAGNWARQWSTNADSAVNTIGSARCDVCHGDGVTSDGTTEDNSWNSGVLDHYSDRGAKAATPGEIIGNHNDGTVCGKCHGLGSAGPDTYTWGTHHEDGAVMMNGPDTEHGTSAGAKYDETNYWCEAACHGGDQSSYAMTTGSAAFGVSYGDYGAGTCDGCHGYPPSSSGDPANNKHVAGATPVYHDSNLSTSMATFLSAHSDCEICHGTKDDGNSQHAPNANYGVSTYHSTGNITMNGPSGTGSGYSESTLGCDNACHANAGTWQMTDSGLTVDYGDFGGGGCTGCHTGSGGGAKDVGDTSSHTSSVVSGSFAGCEFCHFDSHGSKSGGVKVLWDDRTMGASYASGSPDPASYNGIYIRSAYGGSNEANICWNCHKNKGIWEWNKSWGAYSTGKLTKSAADHMDDWTESGVVWESNNFSYKTSYLRSAHETRADMAYTVTSFSYTMPGDAGEISCTSCHDVHGLNNRNDPSYTSSQPPFLRGTWTSNPFPEDGAPSVAHSTWSSDADRSSGGAVPRAAALNETTANELGGWQIEQNNAVSFAETYGKFGGLCQTCHSQSSLESAWSGHMNAVSGFAGGCSNIFAASNRNDSNTLTALDAWMGHIGITQGNSGDPAGYVFGLRNSQTKQFPTGYVTGIDPNDAGKPTFSGLGNLFGGGSVTSMANDEATCQTDFHNFPCSKCHNPHASRLERLMITNCLDVTHNSWDDNHGAPSSWGTTGQGYQATELAYSPTAVNCHRYVGSGDTKQEKTGDPGEPGWNSITPW